jgi:hypothetical protein
MGNLIGGNAVVDETGVIEPLRQQLGRKRWSVDYAGCAKERNYVWTKVCVKSRRNNYAAQLHKWNSCPDDSERDSFMKDIPRTLPQLMCGDTMSEKRLSDHYEQIARVLGALMTTPVMADGVEVLARYRSGASFVVSFLLLAGKDDEEFAYNMLAHVTSHFPTVMPNKTELVGVYMSRIDQMVQSEYPRIHYVFDEMGVHCSHLYFDSGVCLLFCHCSIPFDFTVWCWDQFLYTQSAMTAVVILVALLGSCEQLVINTMEFGGISVSNMISVVDKIKFNDVYANLRRKYLY